MSGDFDIAIYWRELVERLNESMQKDSFSYGVDDDRGYWVEFKDAKGITISTARVKLGETAGWEEGLLTQEGLLLECDDVDGVEGYLTAKEVFDRWIKVYGEPDMFKTLESANGETIFVD